MSAVTLGALRTGLAIASLLLAPAAAWAAEHEVRMKGFRFVPSDLELQAGDTVRWVNTTRIAHTVTADPSLARRSRSVQLPEGAGRFHSGSMKPGEEFTHTFTVPGDYRYFCVPHELAGMIGTISVRP